MLQELLEGSFDKNTETFYTAIPGIILTIRDDLENLYIDVQPVINDKKREGTATERPAVLNVPVQMPSSSTAALTIPLNVGDPVLLIYSMRGLDVWKRGNGRPATPTDFRKFDKRDCFAIPGVWPISRSINNPNKRLWEHDTRDVVLVNGIGTASECEVRLKPNGDVLIRTNQNISVECDNADVLANSSATITTPELTVNAMSTTWVGDINHTGNYTLTGGNATFNSIVFNTHVHGGSPGPSNP